VSWQTEKNGPIACGNEIKDDAGFWRHPQISSAKNKTSGFLGSFFRRKNIGGFCRFLKPAAPATWPIFRIAANSLPPTDFRAQAQEINKEPRQ
jgi:hypothetical protein